MILGLDKLLSKGTEGLAKGIQGILDTVITNKQELKEAELKIQSEISRHQEEMTRLVNEETKILSEDMSNARLVNKELQTSEKTTWLTKNISPLMTIFVTGGFFGLLAYMLNYDVPAENKDILNIMLGTLGTAWVSIIGFHFGSSVGAKSSGDTLRKIALKD